jgi:hypothetical protein
MVMAEKRKPENQDRSQQGQAQRQNQDRNQKPGRNGQGNVADDMIPQRRTSAGRDAHTDRGEHEQDEP